MPKKATEDNKNIKEKKELKSNSNSKKSTKSSPKKDINKSSAKKEEKSNTKNSIKTTKKATKPTTKKTSIKNSIEKVVTKNSSKKTSKTKSKISKNKDKITTKAPNTISGENFSVKEYYDLPYSYNQTVIKLLAQTPNTLFIYWDISAEDRENFKKQYGEDFFEKTRPVLLIHNETKGYTFEVEINDFANCWYLNVNDSKCKYKIELGRKPYEIIYNGEVTGVQTTDKITENYIPITSSNEIESPNDHVLFEKNQEMVYFKNVKTNVTSSKAISSISFLQSIGKVYKINDLYKKFYKDENLDYSDDFQNPSSNSLTSSSFK